MSGWRVEGGVVLGYLSLACGRGLHDLCGGFSSVNGWLCRCSCECRKRRDEARRAEAEAANRQIVASET